MADIIQKKITDNIVAALQNITTGNGYTFTAGAVEQERSVLIVNGRFPFVEVAGPIGSVDTGNQTQGDQHMLEYTITYLDKLNDTDVDNDDPLPEQVANVYGDIHKAMMVDHTRGGNAVMTRLVDYSYTNYTVEDSGEHFEVYMVFEIQSFIDSFDMTQIG